MVFEADHVFDLKMQRSGLIMRLKFAPQTRKGIESASLCGDNSLSIKRKFSILTDKDNGFLNTAEDLHASLKEKLISNTVPHRTGQTVLESLLDVVLLFLSLNGRFCGTLRSPCKVETRAVSGCTLY
ncbi:hypothetical protein NC652_018742 [Populus alba x Populus x berolinensis]|nr:hypothetical protein NC652_018742 [Populus alba x Populus x berolinensis]